MGIEDLLTGIAKSCPDARNEDVYLGIFAGLYLAIDISLYSYKYMAVARKESMKYINPVREDPKPEVLRSFWLEKMFDFFMLFVEELVTPIAVLEGPPFHLKQDTKEERDSRYREREAKILQLRGELIELEGHENPYVEKNVMT